MTLMEMATITRSAHQVLRPFEVEEDDFLAGLSARNFSIDSGDDEALQGPPRVRRETAGRRGT